MNHSYLLWSVLFALPLISILSRLIARRRRAALLASTPAAEPIPPDPLAKRLRVLRLAAEVLLCLGMWQFLKMMNVSMAPPRLAAAFVIMLFVSMIISEFVSTPAQLNTPKLRTGAWANAVLMLALGAVALSTAHRFHTSPHGGEPPIHLSWPLEGRWRVASGGNSPWLNGHHGNPDAQNGAVDFISDDPAKPSKGQPVFAPVSGKVLAMIGDDPGAVGEAEGNFVRIQMPNGTEVLLAHLAPDSIGVERGNPIQAGEPLAAVGDTGSAAVAHLHIHAERNGKPVPLLFGPDEEYLIRGDVRTMSRR